jgi:mono/diheme cytochrome c family protein
MKRTLSTVPFILTVITLSVTLATVAVAADNSAAQKGKMIYSDYCATCHGEQLRNTSGGVTFDLRKLRPDEHERFVNSVLNGKNQMPPWRGVLDPDQVDAIWAYIRTTVDQPTATSATGSGG